MITTLQTIQRRLVSFRPAGRHFILKNPSRGRKLIALMSLQHLLRLLSINAFVFLGLWCSESLATPPINSEPTSAQPSPRFKLLNPEELSPEQAQLARSIRSGPRASTGSSATDPSSPLGSPFNVWLRSPQMGDFIQKLGSQIRFNSSLPPRLNEFAILVTAQYWGSKYEWYAHHRLAMKAGLRPEIAEALLNNERPKDMSEDEAVVYDFSTQLHKTHFVDDETYAHAVKLFEEKGVVDLIAVNGYYDLVSMTLNVDRTAVPKK